MIKQFLLVVDSRIREYLFKDEQNVIEEEATSSLKNDKKQDAEEMREVSRKDDNIQNNQTLVLQNSNSGKYE